MLTMKFNNKGQTLVEALIALTIIITIMTLTTVAVITSLNNANFVKQQTQANKIAQEGMEYIRYQITQNNKFSEYSTYLGPGIARCFGADVNVPPGWASSNCTGENIDGKYRRTAAFTSGQCGTAFTSGMRVLVRVEWRDGKCSGTTFCHSQDVTSCFINPSAATSSPVAPTGI